MDQDGSTLIRESKLGRFPFLVHHNPLVFIVDLDVVFLNAVANIVEDEADPAAVINISAWQDAARGRDIRIDAEFHVVGNGRLAAAVGRGDVLKKANVFPFRQI